MRRIQAYLTHPTVGRFLVRDPGGYGASALNLYAYCGNDPVNGVDPFGFQDTGNPSTGYFKHAVLTAFSWKTAKRFGKSLVQAWLLVQSLISPFSAEGDLTKAEETDASLADVWNLPPTERGVAIEKHLANTEYSTARGWYNVGAEGNGTFPLVDFQQGDTLVSLKTVNTNGSTWLGRMESHITDLSNSGATVDGNPANMVLDLRVQPGGAAAAKPLVRFGAQRGVTVIVSEFK